MPSTITSTQVQAVVSTPLDSLAVPPVVPGRVCAATVIKTVFSASQTVTVGQVIQMVAIPTGCEILDGFVVSNWVGNGAGVFTVGDGSSTNRYVTAASLTASSRITRFSSGIGYKYSVSDDVAVPLRFDTIDISVGAGATQTFTGSILMTVYYRYLGETDQGV